jgi:hypothetical protein
MAQYSFYDDIQAVMALPPEQRHQRLAHLHAQLLQAYQATLNRLTPEEAAQPLSNHDDNRTIAQIVGHIAAWDRFAILAAGDILAGISHPRMITDLEGYREPDGTFPTFATIDHFNDYHAQKYRAWPWEELRRFAYDTATTLFILFTNPQLLSAARLEQTTPFRKRLQNGMVIQDITMGWNLWLTMIEHLAVEHADLLMHH